MKCFQLKSKLNPYGGLIKGDLMCLFFDVPVGRNYASTFRIESKDLETVELFKEYVNI